ncbi:MAG TPA: RNA 2',3'-cyclic phosphodiesterase [Solirubrobacteraceae bacterium]|nr:RNA 2',3'-cyclic phosphodiesterase [Solirubrobacteraceae bacterium]
MSRSATARLFIALELPAPVCERLADWARVALRELGMRASGPESVRVLDPELLHLTLCFLGERPLAEVPDIGDALAGAGAGASVGKLAVGGPLWLPPRRPRALAVEIHDDAHGGLQSLHGELLRALARACGFREEHKRRFRAHVTLARLRGSQSRGSHVPGGPLPPTPALTFTPARLVLYRSRLSPEGASYEALVRPAL